MIVIGVAVIVVIVVLLGRVGRGGAGAERSGPAPAPPAAPDLAADLDRWVAARVLDEEHAAAILGFERGRMAARAPVTVPPAPRPARARRIPPVAEALGYLGGILAVVGLGLVVASYWPDMPTAARLAISGVAAVALVAGGFLVDERADPALARLRWVLWLASTAAAGLVVGVVMVDVIDATDQVTAAVVATAIAVHSGALWAGRDRPLQQLVTLVAVLVAVGTGVLELASDRVAAGAVWAVALGLLALGLRRRTSLPLITEVVGALGAVSGAVWLMSSWSGPGLVLSVATASALLALVGLDDLVPHREDRLVLGAIGAMALLQSLPATLAYFADDAGLVTGLVVWTAGVGLVVLGERGPVRGPALVLSLGGLAMVGGAALTGAQSVTFATTFGLATGLALIAAGMLPGRVMLSAAGSLGLLVNVPWAITWFFPGEGRAPLLIGVSGMLLIGVAVMLTRMGDRFRRELRAPGPPSHPAPL